MIYFLCQAFFLSFSRINGSFLNFALIIPDLYLCNSVDFRKTIEQLLVLAQNTDSPFSYLEMMQKNSQNAKTELHRLDGFAAMLDPTRFFD